ncbi:sugar transferase, partial [candidate division CSSED10-310 bacterium]
SVTRNLIREVENLKTMGFEIIGIVTTDNDTAAENFDDYPILGHYTQLLSLIEKHSINEVIMTPQQTWQDHLISDLARSEKTQARVSIIPSMYEILISRMHHLKIYDIPLVEVVREPTSAITRISKELMDIVFAILGLTITAILFPIAALIIKLESPGPIFYRQDRVGLGGRLFTLYKFRTMVDHAENKTGPVLSKPDDERVTPVGRVLRRWRIDEIPQFYNILKGDMSLVGPRPERPYFTEIYKKEIDGYANRFKAKPGMTGLAQVNGSNQTIPENKLRYDLAYIYNQNLWLDIVIIFETIKVIITGQVS